jgi:hypothetical protein
MHDMEYARHTGIKESGVKKKKKVGEGGEGLIFQVCFAIGI